MNNPFIVAELSCNHLGSLDRAMEIVKAASESGADGVKLQTWTPDTMCLDRNYTIQSGKWIGRSLFDLYREAFTPWEWHKTIFDYARSLGLVAFSSPFDNASVDFLDTLDCPIYKIASFELVDLSLIRYVASKGKPIILSTGMASKEEIDEAINACGFCDVTVLKCTSQYPADASDANLVSMVDYLHDYGLSDHTQGIGVAIAAVAMGASVIEKHLILSRADGGLDAEFSLEPHEFKQMVTECRRAAKSIGVVKYGGESTELRRSLYFARDLKDGHLLTKDDLVIARPALGLNPRCFDNLLGRKLIQDVLSGTPTSWKNING